MLIAVVWSHLAIIAATSPPDASIRPSQGSKPTGTNSWPRFSLAAERVWQLNLPQGQPFDASALLWTKEGQLLTLNDRFSGLYRVDFLTNSSSANLVLIPDCFTPAQLDKLQREKIGRYDCEGIAQDPQGRLYVCEEANRWILRFDPKLKTVDRLEIDWSPVKKYFSPVDFNASFEGIAVGGGRLYVANERQAGRLITVDLRTLKVIDDFAVNPLGSNAADVHYSDLAWFDDALYVLLRESRCVLKVNPASHRVLAEYSFREMERQPEVIYLLLYPTGNMEGLAVDREHIWLVTDNNGLGRVKYPKDIRPTVFRCKRPDQ